MAGEGAFDAGAIVMEFRAQVDDLKVGILQAQNMLQGFGKTAEDTAAKVNRSGANVSNSFSNMDRATLRTAERFARFGASMILLQGQISQLADGASKHFGKFESTASAGAHGLQSFLFVVGAFPTPVGVLVGLLAGMTSAFLHASKSVQEIYDNMEKLEAKIKKNLNEKVFPELAKQLTQQQTATGTAAPIEQSITKQTQALETLNRLYLQGADSIKQNESALDELRATRARMVAELQKDSAARAKGETDVFGNPVDQGLENRINDTIAKLEAMDLREANLKVTIEDATHAQDGQTAAIQKTADAIKQMEQAKDLVAVRDQALKLKEQLDELGVAGAAELQAGLIEPAQQAQRELAAAQAALLKMLEANVALQKASVKLSLAGDEEGANALQQKQFGSEDINLLKDRVAKATADLARDRRINQMASGFADAIGSGLRDAILNAQKPLEALANVGKNLFENMVNQLTTRLQDGLTEVFKQVSQAGGESLGLAITGVLGVLGGIFSKKAGVQQTYSDLSSAVTSTQAVRGVVAGPSSVSIANISADLSRAFTPVLNAITTSNDWLRRIEANTRGGGGGRQSAVGAATA